MQRIVPPGEEAELKKKLHTKPGEGQEMMDEDKEFIDHFEWESVANPLAWGAGKDGKGINFVADGDVLELSEDGKSSLLGEEDYHMLWDETLVHDVGPDDEDAEGSTTTSTTSTSSSSQTERRDGDDEHDASTSSTTTTSSSSTSVSTAEQEQESRPAPELANTTSTTIHPPPETTTKPPSETEPPRNETEPPRPEPDDDEKALVKYPDLFSPRCLTVVRKTRLDDDKNCKGEKGAGGAGGGGGGRGGGKNKIKVKLNLLLTLLKKPGLPTSVKISSGEVSSGATGGGAESSTTSTEYSDVVVETTTQTDFRSATPEGSRLPELSFAELPPHQLSNHDAADRLDRELERRSPSNAFGSRARITTSTASSRSSISPPSIFQIGEREDASFGTSGSGRESCRTRNSFQLGIAPCLRDTTLDEDLAAEAGAAADEEDTPDAVDFERVAGNQRFLWDAASERSGVLAFAPKVAGDAAAAESRGSSESSSAVEISSCVDYQQSNSNEFGPQASCRGDQSTSSSEIMHWRWGVGEANARVLLPDGKKYPPPVASVPPNVVDDYDESEELPDGGGTSASAIPPTFSGVPLIKDEAFQRTQAWIHELQPGGGPQKASGATVAGTSNRALLKISYTSDDHSAWTILTRFRAAAEEPVNKCLTYLSAAQGLENGLPKLGAEIGPVSFGGDRKTRCLEWLPSPAAGAPVKSVYRLQARHTSAKGQFLCLSATKSKREEKYEMNLAECDENAGSSGGKGEQAQATGDAKDKKQTENYSTSGNSWHPQWWLWHDSSASPVETQPAPQPTTPPTNSTTTPAPAAKKLKAFGVHYEDIGEGHCVCRVPGYQGPSPGEDGYRMSEEFFYPRTKFLGRDRAVDYHTCAKKCRDDNVTGGLPHPGRWNETCRGFGNGKLSDDGGGVEKDRCLLFFADDAEIAQTVGESKFPDIALGFQTKARSHEGERLDPTLAEQIGKYYAPFRCNKKIVDEFDCAEFSEGGRWADKTLEDVMIGDDDAASISNAAVREALHCLAEVEGGGGEDALVTQLRRLLDVGTGEDGDGCLRENELDAYLQAHPQQKWREWRAKVCSATKQLHCQTHTDGQQKCQHGTG